MIYGVDVSAYQPSFDFAACRREGFDFAFIKSTQGTGWKNPFFGDQLNRARAAGLLVAAYHYVNGNDVAGQLANVRSMVSTDLPVMLDVEKGAGTIQTIRQLNAELNRVGYRTPLIYIPQWYHRDHMGSPDLRGLPPNWRSWYPDDVVRRKEDAVDAVPNHIWDELVGGIPTVVMQMTSSMAVANYPNGKIDGNVFRGTRDQLAALLGGQEEDDYMALENEIVSVYKAIYEKGGSQGDQSIIERHVEEQLALRKNATEVAAIKQDVAAIKADVKKITVGGIDYDLLAGKVADLIAARLQA